MSHTPKPRSSTGSVKKRVTLRDSKSSNKDDPSTKDESSTRDQELEAEDKNEENTEAVSLSQEELQILDDLHALEMVLGDLINRRVRGSVALKTVNVSPSRRSSSVSAEKIKADEKQSPELEDQTTNEDIRGLDSFLDELTDRRTHGRQTPPVDATTTTTDAEKTTKDIKEPAQLRDSRLSQIVAIDEDITKEIEKIDAELRNTRMKGLLKTGTGQPRLPDPSSSLASHEAAFRSTSQASEVTEDGQYREKSEPKDEEGIWSNLEGFNVPSQSSSVQTLPPPPIEPIVQYNSDFSTASPDVLSSADSFIRRAIQKILDLHAVFPDQKLYLIPSSSFPLAGIPYLTSSIFEIPISAQVNSQVTETPTDRWSFEIPTAAQVNSQVTETPTDRWSFEIPTATQINSQVTEGPTDRWSFEIPTATQINSQVTEGPAGRSSLPGRTPYVSASSPDGNTTAFVEMEAPPEKAIPKKIENPIVQTFVDYFNRSRTKASPTTNADEATSKNLPEIPIIVEASNDETTVSDHYFVVPDERTASIGVLEQTGRTLSLPVQLHGAPLENIGRARDTSPAVLLSAVSSAQPEPTMYDEIMLDRQSGVISSATSTKSEVSGATLKSSLRSGVATQSSTKETLASTCSSSGTVASVPLVTDSHVPAKKKVSFADIPSTMYIIVNSTSEESGAAMKPSVRFESGWETEKGVASKTVYHENDMGATPQQCPSSLLHYCTHPRLTLSTPSYPITAGVFRCCSNEAHRISTETVANLIPSSHVVTGSITHVMTRARSSAEQGRVIPGSRERWVTRINSRNFSCSNDDAVCLCCGSGNFHSNACDCLSIHGVSPTPSDVANALPLHASCSNCRMNTNCSCSRTRSGGDSDSQPPSAKESSTTGSFPEDNDKGRPSSSIGDCNMCGSDNQHSGASSAAGAFLDKCDRKRTKNTTSEK